MVMADEACTGRPVRWWGATGRSGRLAAAGHRWGRRARARVLPRAARHWRSRATARASLVRSAVRSLRSIWVVGPALVGLAAVLALALVYLHVACLETGHRVLALEKELEALRAENEHLQLEALRLSSPARVERVAREKLGMTPVQVARALGSPGPVLAQETAPRPTGSWLERVSSFLAGILRGQGVLAGPAR